MPDCEACWYYDYDEEMEESFCFQQLDEDEWYRICTERRGICPYFRPREITM